MGFLYRVRMFSQQITWTASISLVKNLYHQDWKQTNTKRALNYGISFADAK